MPPPLPTPGTAHSIFRYNDLRFYAIDTDLYRNGVNISSSFDGTRLVFAKAPPTTDVDLAVTQIADHLFIAGGGVALKVDANGTMMSWGITPPVDGFTATINAQTSKQIDAMDSQATWTDSGSTTTDEASIKQEGTNSMQMSVAKKTTGTTTKNITTDLTTFGGGVSSSDADFITFWFRADLPERIDFIQIEFALGATNFDSDFYSRAITIGGPRKRNKPGLASLPQVIDTQVEFIADSNEDDALSPEESDNLVSQLATVGLPIDGNVWTKVRVPKSSFIRSGDDDTLDWADVQSVRLTVKVNARGTVVTYWDDLRLSGAIGMQGRYRYHITYLNNDTGTRSNPNDTYVEVSNVDRQSVALANLPLPGDPQVTHVEIWRTMGDGHFYFFVAKVAAGVTTYTDEVSDFLGMGAADADVLQNEELPFDNVKPSDTFEYCAGPHVGRMWWCNDTESGKGGRVYYSPSGRTEAVKLFVDVTSSDDQTQALAIWNGSIYCFAESGIFEIVGVDEPFIPRRVFGCPGTVLPNSVTRTAVGIVYEAHDGVRIFNGNVSVPLFHEAISKIEHGETVEGIAGFTPIMATYGRDEVYLSDTVVTLACHMTEGRWRELGVAAQALFYEDDTGELIASFTNKLVSLEAFGVTSGDDSVGVNFDVKTPAVMADPNQVTRADTLVIDANTNGQSLTVHIDVDGTEYTIGTLDTTSGRRKHEVHIDRSGRLFSVRISGTLTAQVEIFRVKITMNAPYQPMMLPLELFDPSQQFRGLWLGYSTEVMPRFGLLRAKGIHTINTQTVRSRNGSTKLFDT